MKKILGLVAASLLALSACSGPSTEDKSADSVDKVELKVGHILTPTSHYQVMIDEMAKVAAEASNGAITIASFPQSQLGDEIKMIQATRAGTLSMFISGQAALENTVKEYEIFDLPYLFEDIQQANRVLAGPVGQKYLDMLSQYQLKGLGWLTAMERNVFATKAIHRVEDMSGLKLRVMQAPGYVETYKALGAQPTPMAYSEVYMSLQQGVVNGGDISPDQFMNDRFNEVAKYFNLTKTHYLPALLVMSDRQWQKLSAEQQAIMQEAVAAGLKKGIAFYEQDYLAALEKAKQSGVTVVEPDLSGFHAQAEAVRAGLIKGIPNGALLYQEILDARS